MQTRYFLEMFFFFFLVCVFQYELLKFTELYNGVKRQVNNFYEEVAAKKE